MKTMMLPTKTNELRKVSFFKDLNVLKAARRADMCKANGGQHKDNPGVGQHKDNPGTEAKWPN